MADELCWVRMPSGAYCTSPKGHTGDHIAESTWKGNIIDASREGVPSDDSGGGGGGVVKVKGGCAVVGVALVGGVVASVLGAIEAVRHIL